MPGAATLMLPRFLCAIVCALLWMLSTLFVQIKADRSQPFSWFRSFFCKLIYRFWCYAASWLAFWVHPTYKIEEESAEIKTLYEEYLGTQAEQIECQKATNSRVPRRGIGRTSTIVCNHMGWWEIFCMMICVTFLHFVFWIIWICAVVVKQLELLVVEREVFGV